MTNLTVARFEERRKTTNQPWIRHIRKPPGCNFDVPDLEIAQESCTSQMYNDESNEQAFPCFFCYTLHGKKISFKCQNESNKHMRSRGTFL